MKANYNVQVCRGGSHVALTPHKKQPHYKNNIQYIYRVQLNAYWCGALNQIHVTTNWSIQQIPADEETVIDCVCAGTKRKQNYALNQRH